MSLLSFFSIVLLLSIHQSHAGFFSRRNVTRRMYYNLLKEKEQINPFKNYIPVEPNGKLQNTLNELIDASNFGDAISAGGHSVGEDVLKLYSEKEVKGEPAVPFQIVETPGLQETLDILKDADKFGQEFPPGDQGVEDNDEIRLKTFDAFASFDKPDKLIEASTDDVAKNAIILPGGKYVGENILNIFTDEESQDHDVVRSRTRGRRRRGRKGRKGSLRLPRYLVKKTAIAPEVENRHTRDVKEEETATPQNEVKQLEQIIQVKEQIKETTQKPQTTEKSPEGSLFDWQAPSGQWHLPTGQFQPISGHKNFDNKNQRTTNLFRPAMIYTGELYSKNGG